MTKSVGVAPRAVAATAVEIVIYRHRNLDQALEQAQFATLESRDRALCKALAFGTLRTHERNRALIAKLADRPFRRRDRIVEVLISVGLFALTDSHKPPYAVVSATVDAAKLLGRVPQSKAVNAILRRFLREREDLLSAVAQSDTARLQHPDWLLERFRSDWPDDWENIAAAGNKQAPMWLRINTRVRSRSDWISALPPDIEVAEAPDWLPEAVRLTAAVDVNEIPGFDSGMASVQDAASQFAAGIMAPGQGMRVLDACAAPGGKTGHILERCPEIGELVALDVAADRLQLVQQNLTRLRRTATVIHGDVLKPEVWWDKQPFDRILLDAPCSATGVIRRHPDIRYLRQPHDIDALAVRQLRMLTSAWQMLKPGGKLLYSTCSVLAAENAGVVAQFLDTHSDASEVDITAVQLGPDAREAKHGMQLLPGPAATDGFYYALMMRRPN